jgi:putative Mg2+ transporter-C (MgtC) family protein
MTISIEPADWLNLAQNVFRVLAALLLALPVAWNRERSTRVMGLRTFPLIALASCAYILVGVHVASDNEDAHARLIQGLMSGIGFLGGGAILKDASNGGVQGTATAASVWTTGAVGAAVGFGHYSIAVVVVLVNFFVLRWLSRFKEEVHQKSEKETDEST